MKFELNFVVEFQFSIIIICLSSCFLYIVVENRKTKPPFSVVYQVPTPTTTTAAETAGTSQPEDSQIATI